MHHFEKMPKVLHLKDEENRSYTEVFETKYILEALSTINGPHSEMHHHLLQNGDYRLAITEGSHIIGGLEHRNAKYPLLQPCYYAFPTVLISRDGKYFSLIGPSKYRTNHFAFPNLGPALEPSEEVQQLLRHLNPSIDPKYISTGHHRKGGQGYKYNQLEITKDRQKIERICGNNQFDRQQFPWPFIHTSERGLTKSGFYINDNWQFSAPQPNGLTDHHYSVVGNTPEELENLGVQIFINGQLFREFEMKEIFNQQDFDYSVILSKKPENIEVNLYRKDGILQLIWEGDLGSQLNFFYPGKTEMQRERDRFNTFGYIDEKRFEVTKRNLERIGIKSKSTYHNFAAQGLKTSPNEKLYLLAVEPSDGMHTINKFVGDSVWEGSREIRKEIGFKPRN